MEISDQVKKQINADIQVAVYEVCEKFGMPNITITSDNKLLDEKYDKVIEETVMKGLKESEKSALIADPIQLKIRKGKLKAEFELALEQEIFTKQYISQTKSNVRIQHDEFSSIINQIRKICATEGIDQKIDQRLNEVICDYFGENKIDEEVLKVIIINKILTAKNIRKASNPKNSPEKRSKVWSTEIEIMLKNIIFELNKLKENKNSKSIAKKTNAILKRPIAFSPAKKWKEWDKETKEQFSPAVDSLLGPMHRMQAENDELSKELNGMINDLNKMGQNLTGMPNITYGTTKGKKR